MDTPTPGGKVTARATFAYTAAADDELSFEVGDIITVHEQCEDGWWVAEINEKIGVFPYNYVEIITDDGVTDGGPAGGEAKRSSGGGAGVGVESLGGVDEEVSSAAGTGPPGDASGAVSAVTSPDQVLKQGYLLKKGHVRRNWNKRWFILRAKTLSYYASPGDKTPKGEITLSPESKVGPAAGLKKPEEHPYCLQLTNVTPVGKDAKKKEGFVFYMDASNADDMQQWSDAVELAQKVAFGAT